MRPAEQPSYATKPITAIIESEPLPKELIRTAKWISQYYNTHFATVLQMLLPQGIQKNRRTRTEVNHVVVRNRTNIVLNEEQCAAIQEIEAMTPGTALLHGVTGSGKTEIYVELSKRSIKRNQSVIILVPEIALTSQLLDEFVAVFKDKVVVTHSRQTESERHIIWKKVLYTKTPLIIIGPRSALFMPVRNLGLICIDEAHEPSFKQEQSPRYSALRVASVLASQYKAKVVIGSATPLVTDYYLAKHSERPIIRLARPARSSAVKPTVTIVDMTKRLYFTKHRFLSDALLSQIEHTLGGGNQVLLFHNRRGSASTTLCEHCGWNATCERCFVPLTLHIDKHQLLCHVCGSHERIPTSCPACHNVDIIHKGVGTKLIETEIKKLFPSHTVARFDGDNLSTESIETNYGQLYDGSIDIIIGTQVIAKGFDLPKLRMVGVIQADAGLSLPDYNTSERTFQLLAQAIGRVGRSNHETSAVIQSYQPTHPSITLGILQDYEAFYAIALKERRRALFPPFRYLLKLTCVYKTEKAAIGSSTKLATLLRSKAAPGTIIMGPTPAFYERQHDTYRWQLVIKSQKRLDLIELLRHIPPTHWQYELDPISLL